MKQLLEVKYLFKVNTDDIRDIILVSFLLTFSCSILFLSIPLKKIKKARRFLKFLGGE